MIGVHESLVNAQKAMIKKNNYPGIPPVFNQQEGCKKSWLSEIKTLHGGK
jgi:hypothetical protein